MTIDFASIIIGLLLAVLTGLSGWTLYTVHGLATAAAAREQKDAAQDQSLREDRARIMQAEENINDLDRRVIRLETRRG